MEGVSGEGVRRRREYSEETEETKVAELTATELVRARERALDASESDEQTEVSAKELVEQVVKELREEEKNEGEISRRLEDAIGEIEEMERASESTEKRLRSALEEIEKQEEGVIDESTEERRETEESRFGEVRTKEEFDEAVEKHSEIKLRKSFEKDETEASDYFESIERSEDVEKSGVVEEVESIEKSENPDPPKEAPVGIQELNESWVSDVISESDSRDWNPEYLTEQLLEVSHNLPESSRAFYIDIEKSLGLSSEELGSFEQAFHQVKESSSEIEGVRFGLVGERLYVWKPDGHSGGLENVYDSLYYYFRDKPTFERYVEDVGDSLGLQDKSQSEIRKHLQELAPQMVIEDSGDSCINSQLSRIRGDYVNMMNDISGKTLSNLEGEISKLTKPSGKGGISNPRFPEGELFEVSLSRLTAVAISDCHLKQNGTLEYAESEKSRIRIVEKELQVFGDIKLSPKFREAENLYISYLPTPLGIMLERLGIPSGDRSVQNPGLFSAIKEFSPRARCALIEDLVPQDGTISGKRIQWTHTNILDSPRKNEVYGIESKIGDREIGLIKKHGKRESHSWVLSYGKLKELRNSDSEDAQHIAQDLWRCVYDNHNRLIRDEIEVIRSVGIEYQAKPYAIRYHLRTGRVSVAWTAEPKGLRESIKLGMMAPPNDVVKRKIVKDIIRGHPQYVGDELRQFKKRGIEVDKWWDVENE